MANCHLIAGSTRTDKQPSVLTVTEIHHGISLWLLVGAILGSSLPTDPFLERHTARIARSRDSYRLMRELRDQATTAVNESEIQMKTAVCFEVTVLFMSTFPPRFLSTSTVGEYLRLRESYAFSQKS